MWSDLRKSAAWLLGRGPRRISMDPAYEAERLRNARLIRILVVLGLLAGVGAIYALPSVWRSFKDWRAVRLANEATSAIERREFSPAAAKLQEASALAAAHPNVLVAQARLASASGQGNAVAAWERVVDQPPVAEESWLELGLALLREGRFGEAERALDRAGAARNSARGQWIAGMLAARRGDALRAESLLRESLRVGHADAAEARLTLASLLIGTPKSAEARSLLEALRDDPVFGRRAAGLLVTEAQRAGDLPRAFQLARALTTPPAAQPEDYARLIGLLVVAEDWTGLEEFLEGTLLVGRKDRRVAAALLEALLAHGRFVQAEGWLADLPPEIWASAEVAPAAARLAARDSQRESRLRDVLRRGDWARLEFSKLLFSARLADFEKRDRTRLERWEKARLLAGTEARLLRELAMLAREWNWPREQAQINGILAAHPDASNADLRAWWAGAKSLRDTTTVANATRQLLAAGDFSTPVKVDYIRSTLVLNQDPGRALQFARELSASEPANAEVVAMQARALRVQDRSAEAIDVLNAAATRKLSDPLLDFERVVAVYTSGQKEAAAKLAAALPAQEWFPEEVALLTRIKAP